MTSTMQDALSCHACKWLSLAQRYCHLISKGHCNQQQPRLYQEWLLEILVVIAQRSHLQDWAAVQTDQSSAAAACCVLPLLPAHFTWKVRLQCMTGCICRVVEGLCPCIGNGALHPLSRTRGTTLSPKRSCPWPVSWIGLSMTAW